MRNTIKAIIRDARICSKNFKGAASKYNREGDRGFTLQLDPEQGEEMLADGWNVKVKPGREEGDPDRYFLNVTVRYGLYPPSVVLVTSKNKTPLSEDEVGRLDGCIFEKADIVLNGSEWHGDGDRHGIKAYLKTGYFTIEEDEFAEEYGML